MGLCGRPEVPGLPFNPVFSKEREAEGGGRGHLPVCATLLVFGPPRSVLPACLALRGSTAGLCLPRRLPPPPREAAAAAAAARSPLHSCSLSGLPPRLCPVPPLPFSAVPRTHSALPTPLLSKFVSLG